MCQTSQPKTYLLKKKNKKLISYFINSLACKIYDSLVIKKLIALSEHIGWTCITCKKGERWGTEKANQNWKKKRKKQEKEETNAPPLRIKKKINKLKKR